MIELQAERFGAWRRRQSLLARQTMKLVQWMGVIGLFYLIARLALYVPASLAKEQNPARAGQVEQIADSAMLIVSLILLAAVAVQVIGFAIRVCDAALRLRARRIAARDMS
jgi:hypothetical protein